RLRLRRLNELKSPGVIRGFFVSWFLLRMRFAPESAAQRLRPPCGEGMRVGGCGKRLEEPPPSAATALRPSCAAFPTRGESRSRGCGRGIEEPLFRQGKFQQQIALPV